MENYIQKIMKITYNNIFKILDDDCICEEYVIESDDNKIEYPKLSDAKKSKENLDDNDFGLPSERKYPLTRKESVENAIKYFKFVPNVNKEELAQNLLKAIKKYKIKVMVTSDNPFLAYYPKAVIIPRAKKK